MCSVAGARPWPVETLHRVNEQIGRRRPEYPDEVRAADVYSAVPDDGVRDPEGSATWLTRRASSVPGA